jgi:hypothetical protein
MLQAQPEEQQELRAQSRQSTPGRRVSLRELLVRRLWLVQVSRAKAQHAQVSPPRALQQVVLQSQLALRPLASPPLAGALAQPEEQQEPPLELAAFSELPSPPLLSLIARLPRRFPHPLHLADGA